MTTPGHRIPAEAQGDTPKADRRLMAVTAIAKTTQNGNKKL
jgi:hypothetical protein